MPLLLLDLLVIFFHVFLASLCLALADTACNALGVAVLDLVLYAGLLLDVLLLSTLLVAPVLDLVLCAGLFVAVLLLSVVQVVRRLIVAFFFCTLGSG